MVALEGHLQDNAPNDDELVLRTLNGYADAFEVLLNRYSQEVFKITGRFFRDYERRESLVQDTFIKAYQALCTYRLGASFERWLRRIAVNTCFDELRRLKHRKEFSLAEITTNENRWLEDALSKPAIKLFEAKKQTEEAALLAERLLEFLAPEDRMVILFYERDGLSTAEIAELTGWSTSKVKIRLFRARRRLHKRIQSMIEGFRASHQAKESK